MSINKTGRSGRISVEHIPHQAGRFLLDRTDQYDNHCGGAGIHFTMFFCKTPLLDLIKLSGQRTDTVFMGFWVSTALWTHFIQIIDHSEILSLNRGPNSAAALMTPCLLQSNWVRQWYHTQAHELLPHFSCNLPPSIGMLAGAVWPKLTTVTMQWVEKHYRRLSYPDSKMTAHLNKTAEMGDKLGWDSSRAFDEMVMMRMQPVDSHGKLTRWHECDQEAETERAHVTQWACRP